MGAPSPTPMPRLAPVLLTVLLPAVAAAQPLTLTPRAEANAALPPSVRAFEVTREGTALRALLVRADLAADDWELEAVFSDEGTETVASFAEDDGVLAVVNGGYFGGGQSYSLVLNDGVVLAPNIKAISRTSGLFYPTRSAVGVSAARVPDVAWVYDVAGVTYAYPQPSPNAPDAPQPQPSAQFPDGGAPWDVETAIGGGPVLVQDGEAAITWTEEVFFGGSGVDLTTARARTAAGYTASGALLLVAVSEANGLTLPALAQLMVDLGAVEALNLDGGGSTALSAGGVALVSSFRPVATALRIRAAGDEGDGEGIVFDTGDAGYRETGTWIESANAPFVGGTPSRLNAVGDGSDRAVFTFAGIEARTYAVEAWWTASANRATNAPFTVYHDGVGQTVRLDQTPASTGGTWNRIGEFALAPGDSLVVTDDASGTASPAYVVVDAVRLVPVGGTAAEPAPAPARLRVWPNPSAGAVTVALDGPGRVEVLDVLGRVVRLLDAAGRPVQIDGLAVGVYTVRATAGADVRAVRITVVR